MSALPAQLAEGPEQLPGGAPRARRLRAWLWPQDRGARVGVVILGLLVLCAVCAPLIAPYGPKERIGTAFQAPSSAHWLGLDDGGFDMFSLVVYGARISLLLGFSASVVAVTIGGLVGLLAGYSRGWLDLVLMQVTEYFLVVPALPLMIVIGAVYGTSVGTLIIIIGALSWPATAIVVRAQARSVRERVYVRRALATGASHRRVLVHHMLPQVLPLLVANATLTVGNVIFTESALAFLGLGDPSVTSWGRLIQNAFNASAVSDGAWWAFVPPGLAIALTVLGTALLGRALEDAANPRVGFSHLAVPDRHDDPQGAR